MESSREKASRTPCQNAHELGRTKVLAKFSELFDLTKNKEFQKALKQAYLGEFIPFLKAIKKILQDKTPTKTQLENFYHTYLAISKDTGFFMPKNSKKVNLSNDVIKTTFLRRVTEINHTVSQEQLCPVINALEEMLKDIQETIVHNSTSTDNHPLSPFVKKLQTPFQANFASF